MIKKILITLLFAFGFALPAYAATPTIEIWWPTTNSELQGTQPFKGLVKDMSLNQYTMYWQVDGGNLVAMNDNYQDYPHKEATVDLSGWSWKGTGPYVLNFVAKDSSGKIISETTRTIYTGPKAVAPVAPVAPPTVSRPAIVTTEAVVAPKPATAPVTSTLTAIVVSPPTTPTKKLYVDVNSQAAAATKSATGAAATLLKKISDNPTAVWLGNWYNDTQTKDKVVSVMAGAKAANATPTFVLYNIPQRDCGSYSAGGANNPDGYRSWINIIANAIGNNTAIVVLEPDALAQANCLNSTDQATRMSLLNGAVTTLKAKTGISVYLDAGHNGWKSVDEMAGLLTSAGIAKADGFALNVSNYQTTAESLGYGKAISAKTGGKHFVVDTSRNGNGSNGEWCNPNGRALGEKPTLTTGEPLVDGYLWIKAPGESDGTCNGGPSAGTWWTSYALGLATLSRW